MVLSVESGSLPPDWKFRPSTRHLAPGESIQIQSIPFCSPQLYMMSQATEYSVSSAYLSSRMQYERVKFFRSCVIERLIPRGMRVKLNLAGSVNDFELVRNIENVLSKESSKQLDLLYLSSQNDLTKLKNQYDDQKEMLSREVRKTDFKHIVIQIKRENHYIIHLKNVELKRKLEALRL